MNLQYVVTYYPEYQISLLFTLQPAVFKLQAMTPNDPQIILNRKRSKAPHKHITTTPESQWSQNDFEH